MSIFGGGVLQRAGLEEAVEAVLVTLGMAPCEGTDAVPPNARHASHSILHPGFTIRVGV